MTYLIYILFGLLPSIIWLLFYLRKDSHPEPKKMVLKIFIYGMLIAFVAAGIELFILWSVTKTAENLITAHPLIFMLFSHFIGIALVEEYLKYLVVRQKILKDPEFDEPTDAMIYMIITALGFAALENVLVLLPAGRMLLETLSISVFRFIGATFLHALASGAIGYFLALSLFQTKKRFRLIFTGIMLAVLLHGIYNISIIKIADSFYYALAPLILLTSMAIFVSYGFKRIKRIKSTCKVVK